MPSHRKYGTPTCQPADSAMRNSARCDAKNSVTHCTSWMRLTRDANAPYAGTSTSNSSAWPGG